MFNEAHERIVILYSCVHLPSSFAVAHFYSPQRNISYLFLAHFLIASKDSFFFLYSSIYAHSICLFFVSNTKNAFMVLQKKNLNFTSSYSRLSGLSVRRTQHKKKMKRRKKKLNMRHIILESYFLLLLSPFLD